MKDFVPSELVVMRTPLLPLEELQAWTAGLQAPRLDRETAEDAAFEEAIAHDRRLLRTRLEALLERPEIAEAIFLASPDLVESIPQWRRDPESKKGKRTEDGLVRYFLRMATRSTPFGLFSGCTSGRTGERTRLALDERHAYRRYSRLDMDYLFALCEHLSRDPEIRASVLFRPNSSLYESAGRLRFAESRVRGSLRTYHLVAFEAFDALRDTLQRAAGGARLHDLAEMLVASDADGEITLADAAAFLDDLVDNQLLLPDLALPVTGEDHTAELRKQLDALQVAAEARRRLAHAESTLQRIDAAGPGSAPERYRELARELEPLGVPVEVSRLFQVDLMKPASELVVGELVIAEALRSVEIVHRLSKPRNESALDDFRRAFQERYGTDREVPLLAALDEESGIGFERSGSAAAEASPLLSGLKFQRRNEAMQRTFGANDAVLLQLLGRALGEGRMEIALTDDDLKRLSGQERPPLPDAFHAMFTLAAASSEAIERGEFRLLSLGALGPSGARMLGRFCHLDDAIRKGVESHVAAEEALRPDAIFAELVHLPAGRLGNILARPVLREYEIVFLGCSGAPRERQIPLDDLLVTVSGDRIRLRSKHLGREIIPRLTNAHNTSGESLGVYRFLGALQHSMLMGWSWGPLDTAPFLPRVVSGRVVLARARWRISGDEIRPMAAATGATRFRLAQRLRHERHMPRYIVLSEGDQELLIDFENSLSLDAWIDLIRNREDLILTELYPASDELCAEGPEGRFFHELIVPFTRRPAAATALPAEAPTAPALQITRTFPPGSEWLYAKVYTGTATADRVLEELAPLAAEAVASGAVQRWFFIRYGDPDWHLRIRFQGNPAMLRGQVQPALETLGERLIEAGAAWKLQFDTYEREVERYGGPEAIELAEEVFFRDSEAVLALLGSCGGDAGSELRWRLMVAGIDALYGDFGLDRQARLELAERGRDSFGQLFRYDTLCDHLADRFRGERGGLQRLLDAGPGHADLAAIEQRSAAMAGIPRQLLALERRGRLSIPVKSIIPSLVHMFINRLSRSAGPEHELVLYDFLVQLYRSQLARAAKGGRAPAERLAVTG
jgi:thiopeptide-type bacteriocin biosynthesis protein